MPASLKYYKIDYIPISDRMYYEYADELLKHIRELVELEKTVSIIFRKFIFSRRCIIVSWLWTDRQPCTGVPNQTGDSC